MNRHLLWRLVTGILLGAMVMFTLLHQISNHLTIQMTEIDLQDQALLQGYANRAEQAFVLGDLNKIAVLSAEIAKELGVWAAVIGYNHESMLNLSLPDHLRNKLGFQRQLNWPVHPFMEHVLIGFPLADKNASFVIELPEVMHPKPNTEQVKLLLTLVIPSLLLSLFCWGLYRYLMRPLEALSRGATQLASGDLSARVLPTISQQRDEIAQVAISFDTMAERIENLVHSQRQMLGDLSHELRTPIARFELALDLVDEDELSIKELNLRLRKDVKVMKDLVEDALTLAWLESDPMIDCAENFDLAVLLDLICDDAEFEFPDHAIKRNYSTPIFLKNSNQKALAHSIENILRNALKYSPEKGEVTVACKVESKGLTLSIVDQGPGVEASALVKIFKPFFREDKSRSNELGGFGLGLAIAKRQLNAINAQLWACNQPEAGLCITINFHGDTGLNQVSKPANPT